MAAHEGSDHAEQAERRDIGEATLEQLRADVVRQSLESMTAEPFPVFREMRRLRSRIYAALDRQLWPRDQTELYFLLGALNCLMAVAASDLGYSQAGEELVRAAWAYATAIDHRPLMAHLRLELAGIAYWQRPRQSRDLAQSGLRYLSDGPNAAQLYLQYGRAAARLGDASAARSAIEAATEARERDHQDDLLEIGGEFGFSRATQHYMAGSGLLEIPQAESVALEELQRATELYAAGPGSGEQYGYGSVALARVELGHRSAPHGTPRRCGRCPRASPCRISGAADQRDPPASGPGPLRTSPQPLPGLSPGHGTGRADRRLHPRDHRQRPARPPRRLRLTNHPAREPSAPTTGSALAITQLPIWVSPVLTSTCPRGRDRSWPPMPQPQTRPH